MKILNINEIENISGGCDCACTICQSWHKVGIRYKCGLSFTSHIGDAVSLTECWNMCRNQKNYDDSFSCKKK